MFANNENNESALNIQRESDIQSSWKIATRADYYYALKYSRRNVIQIKEAYRLLRRNKRKSITMAIKIFILVKTAVILLHYNCVRCFSCSSNLFSVLEYFLFVEFLYHHFVRRLLLYCYFVGEEERVEIDFELLTILLEFQALEDFLISDLDDALVINMVQSGKCKKYTLIIRYRCPTLRVVYNVLRF